MCRNIFFASQFVKLSATSSSINIIPSLEHLVFLYPRCHMNLKGRKLHITWWFCMVFSDHLIYTILLKCVIAKWYNSNFRSLVVFAFTFASLWSVSTVGKVHIISDLPSCLTSAIFIFAQGWWSHSMSIGGSPVALTHFILINLFI